MEIFLNDFRTKKRNRQRTKRQRFEKSIEKPRAPTILVRENACDDPVFQPLYTRCIIKTKTGARPSVKVWVTLTKAAFAYRSLRIFVPLLPPKPLYFDGHPKGRGQRKGAVVEAGTDTVVAAARRFRWWGWWRRRGGGDYDDGVHTHTYDWWVV